MIAATHYSPVTRPGERKALHMAKVRQRTWRRSEEHTSELQSPCNLVCRLLLEKKKNNAPARITRNISSSVFQCTATLTPASSTRLTAPPISSIDKCVRYPHDMTKRYSSDNVIY